MTFQYFPYSLGIKSFPVQVHNFLRTGADLKKIKEKGKTKISNNLNYNQNLNRLSIKQLKVYSDFQIYCFLPGHSNKYVYSGSR